MLYTIALKSGHIIEVEVASGPNLIDALTEGAHSNAANNFWVDPVGFMVNLSEVAAVHPTKNTGGNHGTT